MAAGDQRVTRRFFLPDLPEPKVAGYKESLGSWGFLAFSPCFRRLMRASFSDRFHFLVLFS